MFYVLAMKRDYNTFRNPGNDNRRPGWYGPLANKEAVSSFIRESECSVFLTKLIMPFTIDKDDREIMTKAKKV